MGEIVSNLGKPSIIMAFILGLIISLVLGKVLIPLLHKLKFGQNIRKDGPQAHLKKAGTPTIGGLIFIGSSTIVMVLMNYSFFDKGMIILYALLAFGFVGFLDDILKIIHKNNLGLTAWQKMALLVLFSVAFAFYGKAYLGTGVDFPFFNGSADLGLLTFENGVLDLKLLFIPFIILYFATVTNAVNLTDGLDGLASFVSVIVLAFFAVVSSGMGQESVTVFIVALIGSLLGFLYFNAYPAKVFMGDTGSLALGGAVGAIAMMLKIEFMLLIVGGIYAMEVLSVVIQVTSFKLTGKRVFKMAPLHHHFEHLGWSENKIVFTFSAITAILCVMGYLLL